MKMCFNHSSFKVKNTCVELGLLTSYKSGDKHSGLSILKIRTVNINSHPFVGLEFKNECIDLIYHFIRIKVFMNCKLKLRERTSFNAQFKCLKGANQG